MIRPLDSLYLLRAIYKTKRIFFYSAHYFCLLFASSMEQSGEDEEGIKGFLPNDILKELRRGARLKCHYCEKKYGKFLL